MAKAKTKKTLADYLLMKQNPYKYKIKFAYPLEEHHFDRIGSILDKYELVSINNINRLPYQKNPLDFPTVDASEIYLIEVETLIPMSEHALRYELKKATKIHEDFISIRNENNPYNKYEEDMIKFQEKKYVTKLEDPNYESDGVEDQNLYGDEYNKEMVDTLTKDSGDATPHIKSEFKKAVEKFNETGVFTKVNK